MSAIAENIAGIRRRILAAGGSGDVLVVAAAKMNGAQSVRRAIEAGIDAVGENRVQEMLEKNERHAYDGAPLHFIGRLQKNKVNKVVGLCDLIQSVDSPELLRLIDARAKALSVTQEVLLEVNIANEASKSGVEPESLDRLIESAAGYGNIRVMGLMAIPPAQGSADEMKGYFSSMYKLFVDIGAKKYDNVNMRFLSMGMSGDFEQAVSEGANVVRIGSAIFGAREY